MKDNNGTSEKTEYCHGAGNWGKTQILKRKNTLELPGETVKHTYYQ